MEVTGAQVPARAGKRGGALPVCQGERDVYPWGGPGRGEPVSPPVGLHLLPRASSPTEREPLEAREHTCQLGVSRRTPERP